MAYTQGISKLSLREIFAGIGVEPSTKEGLNGDTKNLPASGDGTCVNSGSSSYGNNVCNCAENGNYNCDCARKFSVPYARWGWDSYHLGKVESCNCKEQCSPSKYGRCVYIKPAWDLRLFTAVPRGSDIWKEEMNSRTTSERVNKRILNNYGLELSHTRGKKRTFWWSVVHSLNVLLDARLKLSGFNFMDLLAQKLPQVA